MNVLELKALVRFRDGNRCTGCGMTNEEHLERFRKGLEVHRKSPGSKYSLEGCETLCRPCHGKKPKSPAGTHEDQLFLRLPDPRLAPILTTLAKARNRSRNLEIVDILEREARQAGLWPPKPSP